MPFISREFEKCNEAKPGSESAFNFTASTGNEVKQMTWRAK